MKTNKHILTIFGTLLVLSFLLFSCSTSKKTAVSCPEFSVYKNSKVAFNHPRNKVFVSHNSVIAGKQPLRQARINKKKDINGFKNSTLHDDLIVTAANSVFSFNKIEYSKRLIASVDNSIIPFVGNITDDLSLKKPDLTEQPKDLIITQPVVCDTIVLKSGSLLIGKVEEIGQNEIKYRKCNNLTGPVISILKSDVSVIIYKNGTHDFITPANTLESSQINTTASFNNEPVKTEGLAVAGFVSSLLGLFISGILLGLLGVVFGGVSLSRIKKQPDKLMGKGLAVASIVIGIIAFIGAIIVIAAI